MKSRCGVWYTVHVSAGGSVSVMAALTSGALADWPLADIAACAAGSHLGAIELTVGPDGHVSSFDAAQEAELGRALATLDGVGLALCGVAATGTLVLGHPDLGPYARLAAGAGAEFMRVFPAAFSSDSTPVHQISSAALALAVLAAEAPGIRILVEMSPGSVIPSPELALRVLELSGVDDAGVVYDPANLIEEGHLQPSYAVALLGEADRARARQEPAHGARRGHVGRDARADRRRHGRLAGDARGPVAERVPRRAGDRPPLGCGRRTYAPCRRVGTHPAHI